MASHAPNLIFGTGIINIFSRSPGSMAQAAASISEQTDGRFILGIGLSGPNVIEKWHGLDYYNGSPMQRTREYLELIRLIFSGERANYQGELFKVHGFKLRSFEAPINVPIYLAAFGKKNVQLAAELADGWFPIWTSFSELKSVKTSFTQGLSRRKQSLPSNVEIAPFIVTCASTNEKAKYYVQKQLAFYIGGMGTYYARVVKEYGFIEEVDKIRTAWNAGERETALKLVTDEMLDRLAAVGSPEKVLARYEDLRKAGATQPVVWLPTSCPPDLAMETIQTFTN